MQVHSIYKRGCISCGGEITDERLATLGVCSKCYPKTTTNLEDILPELHSRQKISELVAIRNEVREWVELFSKILGTTPWNTQVTWAKRAILGRSFSLIAPTGVGKTTFGLVTAINFAIKGKKSIIILPTTNLVIQTFEKLKKFSKLAGKKITILMYSSKFTPKKQKEKFKEDITKGSYDIVVITSNMVKNLVSLKPNMKFDFIFADDVDSLLKRSKNIEYLITLSGLTKEDIKTALEFIKLKFLLAVSKGKDTFENNLEKYKEIEPEIGKIKSKDKGIIVVSSATAKPRGARVKLFKELFNFEIGNKSEVVRNIGNYYIVSEKTEDELIRVLNLLGDGGIVFVPPEEGIEYAEKVSSLINSKTKLKSAVISYQKGAKELGMFKSRKINVLVGVSTYYGTLVRGLDIPERIVYSVFLGLPKFRVTVDPNNLIVSPYQILKLLSEIVGNIDDTKKKREVESFIRKFRQRTNHEPFITQGKDFLREFLKQEKYISTLRNATDIVFESSENGNFVLIPDINTYIQGSGRTSRLYPGGMTRGISVIIESNRKLLDVGARKYKWIEEIEWKEFSESEVLKDLSIAREDRKKLKLIVEGKAESEIKQLNKTILIIVESPTKAKTISRILGTPAERIIKGLNCYEVTAGNITFIVTSSKGHIFELTTDSENLYGMRIVDGIPIPIYDTIRRCQKCNRTFVSIENSCKYCKYEKYVDRFDDIVALIELAKEVDEVLLASDPDTEGEKISYDIFVFLNAYVKFFGGKVKRMKFHEVTYHAIKNSIEHPEEININLVEAQLLRRIQDRLIGFGLSDFLKDKLEEKNVSAGRVQSPVLGWIVERFKDYRTLISHFTKLTFSSESGEEILLIVEGRREEIGLREGEETEVEVANQKEVELSPPPPFTTDTVLIQTNKLFGMQSDETMAILQDLFEEGLITYHRTDSTTVSTLGQNIAKEYLHIRGLEELSFPRGWESEGAHECIRPTRSIDSLTLSQLINEGVIVAPTVKKSHLIVYDMIFKRFIASQMKPTLVKNVDFIIRVGSREITISRNIEVIERGWSEIGYLQIEKQLPPKLLLKTVTEIKKPKVSLFSEGDIIQMMKQKGIGRPSTYSKTISILIKRGYVVRKNNKLIPTTKGIMAYESLKEEYEKFVSEERTRYVEELMDKVEQGYENYFTAVRDLLEEYNTLLSSQEKV
ncbi:MAG: reverse gyrase [Brevinematia bacterium]